MIALTSIEAMLYAGLSIVFLLGVVTMAMGMVAGK